MASDIILLSTEGKKRRYKRKENPEKNKQHKIQQIP